MPELTTLTGIRVEIPPGRYTIEQFNFVGVPVWGIMVGEQAVPLWRANPTPNHAMSFIRIPEPALVAEVKPEYLEPHSTAEDEDA